MSTSTRNAARVSVYDGPELSALSAADSAPPSLPCDVFLRRIFAAHPGKFGHILENAEQYRFQVLLSVPSEGEDCQTVLKRHEFRADAEYFYPASSIKICAAIAAIQKLRRIKRKLPGVSVDCATPLAFLPLFRDQSLEATDSSNLDGSTITIGHEIRKLFLVSDNSAFNRLYDFVGQRDLNQAMWGLGLSSVRIRHRLSDPMPEEDYKMGRPIELRAPSGGAFCLPPKFCQLALPSSRHLAGIRVGSAYIEDDGTRVAGPMDFSHKNAVSLHHLQALLASVFHPALQTRRGAASDCNGSLGVLLKEAMVQFPQQSRNPQYRKKEFPDDYCKFFLPGLCRVRPKGALRIFNKIGQAYGFTVENAYIVDIETGRDFYLSTVLYTNANGVLNDDRYEYDTAYRVTADVAEVVARALWQIPLDQSLSATCLDGIPSGFWEKTLEASKGGGGRIVPDKEITGSVQPSTNGVTESNVGNGESGSEGKEFSDAMSVGADYMVKHATPAVSPVRGGLECVKDSNIVFLLPLDECCDTLKNVGVAEGTLLPNETTKNFEDFATLDQMSATFDHCDSESKHGIVCEDGALKKVELGSETNVEFEQFCNIHGARNEVVDTCENLEEEEEVLEQVGPPRRSLMPFYHYFVDE